jgi:hypothetical protein
VWVLIRSDWKVKCQEVMLMLMLMAEARLHVEHGVKTTIVEHITSQNEHSTCRVLYTILGHMYLATVAGGEVQMK